MEDKLIESLISSGVPAIVIIAGLYFGKNLIEHFFNETIELKKKELEQENKNFQHQLDAKLQEFNIKFSSLHLERANVIRDLYTKLILLHSAMFSYTREGQIVYNDAKKEDQERLDMVNNTLKNFADFYHPNKIYFTKSIVDKIDLLFKEYSKTRYDFTKVLKDSYNPPNHRNSRVNNWSEISEKVGNYYPIIIQEIENEFRKILGVEN